MEWDACANVRWCVIGGQRRAPSVGLSPTRQSHGQILREGTAASLSLAQAKWARARVYSRQNSHPTHRQGLRQAGTRKVLRSLTL